MSGASAAVAAHGTSDSRGAAVAGSAGDDGSRAAVGGRSTAVADGGIGTGPDRMAAGSGSSLGTKVGMSGAAAAPSSGSGGSSVGGAAPVSSGSGGPNVGGVAPPSSGSGGDQDAGTAPPRDAGNTAAGTTRNCEADLAQCILDSPLDYATCLRKQSNNGCPLPDAGVTDTSILDENGNPISQVCQAELAQCITRMPTPDNALECTEAARKCK